MNTMTTTPATDNIDQAANLVLLEGLASYEKTTANTLHRLAKDAVKFEACGFLCYCISKNKNTSAETLELLFEHGRALNAVASNPNTPVSILEVLTTHEYFTVRIGVAMNTSTPKHLLEVLATDHEENVRDYAQEQLNKR